MLAVGVLALTACQDSPPVVAPEAEPSLSRSPAAQERLEAILQRTSPEVLALQGVVFTDHDESAGELVVGIERIGVAQGVQNALARGGAAPNEMRIVLSPPILNMATLRDQFRPTINGVQLNFMSGGSSYACTLGFNVTSGSGQRSFITNSHCTDTQGGVDNTSYGQALLSQGIVATEVADPTYSANLSGCPLTRRCRYSDAARAEYVTAVASERGLIAKTESSSKRKGAVEGLNTGSLTVNGALTITQQSASSSTPAAVNAIVHKVGRTTGWTSGTVTNTCANVNVSGTDITLLCQTIVQGRRTLVGGGDSGSGAFIRDNGDNVTLVGILWGGSSNGRLFVFSPLKNIFDELGSFTATR